MADEKYTRCPSCRTVFRVTPAQLALREGQVRCGHCRTVFDGTSNLIQLAPVVAFAAPPEDDATGPLTVTLRSAQALEPMPAPQAAPAAAPSVTPTPPAQPPQAATARASREDDDQVDYDSRFAWDRPRKRSRRQTLLYALAIVALVLIFVGQLAWHYRDALAAHVPATRPILTRACAIANCTVGPLREIAGLSIDASDLQADPAHKGLLTLTATLRNRANYAVAYPHLELTLTDLQDRPVVRRALAPQEYAGGTASLGTGIPANGEVALKLFLDASATTQSGYRVYLFYP
jgi:predicted Zn finger-like uncharacterized protein